MKSNRALNVPSLVVICLILFISSCTDEISHNTPIDQKMVVTPFGLIDKAKVHHIEGGYAVKIDRNHLLKVEHSTGKLIQDLGELVQTETMNPAARTTTSDPTVANDIVVAFKSSALSHTNFRSNFIVPVAPTQNTQTLFIGTRMLIQSSYQTLLEPVLQYGSSVAGGGQYWSAASWQQTGGIVTYTTLVQNIAPGTVLSPVLQYNSGAYTAYFANFPGAKTFTNALTNSNLYFFLGRGS